MFGKRVTLFKLFGFSVYLDASWVFIALLVTWSLAVGYFPMNYPDLAPSIYWLMGIVGAAGLFGSIIFHEFSHSLVARRYGLPMKGITLFLFGGISEMMEEPSNPKTEFLMAAAGPASSIVLGFCFYLLFDWGKDAGWPGAVLGIVGYLAFINWVLAGFNLLPAFPLDGGRMLRSALWRWKKDLLWATRTATGFGSGFGIALMFLGILSLFTGNLVGGIWYFIIGIFLRSAAQSTYRQLLMRDTLEGKRVRDLMRPNPVTAPASISVRDLVENYMYKYHFKMFPVVQDERVVGCISSRRIKEIPREDWDSLSVSAALDACSGENTISPQVEASKALSVMNRTGNSRLLVVEGEHLEGVITLKDILGSLSIREELKDWNSR